MSMNEKRLVMLENYGKTEGACQCGCGMNLDGRFLVRLQAFVYRLENLYGSDIRHRITSGARCKSRNDAIPGSAKYSQHLDGLAADGHFDRFVSGKWCHVPEADIAHNAIESRLFTGVGWKKYDSQFIHLDARPGQTIITW